MSEQQKSRSVTVTGDIGEYRTGQILKDSDAIVKYYRTVIAEGATTLDAEKQKSLTDQQILDVIDSIPGDTEDEEILRVEKLESIAG